MCDYIRDEVNVNALVFVSEYRLLVTIVESNNFHLLTVSPFDRSLGPVIGYSYRNGSVYHGILGYHDLSSSHVRSPSVVAFHSIGSPYPRSCIVLLGPQLQRLATR